MNFQNRMSTTFADKPPMPMHQSFSHSSLGGLIGKRMGSQRNKVQRISSGHHRIKRNYGPASIGHAHEIKEDGSYHPAVREKNNILNMSYNSGKAGLRQKFKNVLKNQV